MDEPPRLYGLKAVVVNAAQGVGEAAARTLSKHGAEVAALGDEVSGVEQHFKSVKGINGLRADLAQPDRQAASIDAAHKALGGIDILVCDFPMRPREPIVRDGEELDNLLAHRSDMTRAVCRAALPHLKKSPAGRIIIVGFLRSIFAADGGDARDRAEQDLAAQTRALSTEFGEFGITVNYVQPGAIMTPTSREVFRKHRELRDFCIASTLARRLGDPVDVAKVILFFASDDAMFVNGSGVVVDGGRTGV